MEVYNLIQRFKSKGNWRMLLVLAGASLVFASISLANHFCFRTYALDLGMFNQAMYAFTSNSPALFTQGLNGDHVPYLCDHFSPIIFLLSPLRFLFGDVSLLIVQIVAVLLFAWYSYKLALLKGIDNVLSTWIGFFSICFWGIYGAVSYDFHTNVIAACLLVPFYYHLIKNQILPAGLFFLLILMCKENSGLLCFFFLIAISIDKGIGRSALLRNLALSFVSLLVFFVVVLKVMPSQCDGLVPNVETFYGGFGHGFGEAMVNMVTSPWEVIKLIVLDSSGEIAKSKTTTLWVLLLSGGVFVLFRPQLLIFILPVLFQKFLSSNQLLWDVQYHYSIEFAPALIIAVIYFVLRFQNKKWVKYAVAFSALLTLFVAWRSVIGRTNSCNPIAKGHYENAFSVQEFELFLELIPSTDAVSCSPNLSPHLSFRPLVYVFPVHGNAKYALLDKTADFSYPLNKTEFYGELEKMKMNGEFEIVKESENLILFRRINS